MANLSRRELGDLIAQHLGDKVDGLMLAAISAFVSTAPDEVIDLIAAQQETLMAAFESEGVQGVRRVLAELDVPPELQELVLAHVPGQPDDPD